MQSSNDSHHRSLLSSPRGQHRLAPARSAEVEQNSSPAHNRGAEQRNTKMSCLGRAAVPVKRVWRGLSARLRLRRATGLGRLRKEERTCEYSDVHVMWEMLSSSKSTSGGGAGAMVAGDAAATAGRKGSGRRSVGRKAAVAWSRLASYCCAL